MNDFWGRRVIIVRGYHNYVNLSCPLISQPQVAESMSTREAKFQVLKDTQAETERERKSKRTKELVVENEIGKMQQNSSFIC